jgi:hypothetical protein
MLRPNPPRMVTVLLALALLAIGLGLQYLDGPTVRDLIGALSLPGSLERDLIRLARDETTSYAAQAAAPLLLAAGSLLPGI